MSDAKNRLPQRVLIVIPAYHEEETIREVVQGVHRHVPGATVVVVNDGSTDGTEAAAREAGAVVLTLPFNLGIGAAMQTGYRYADEEGFDIAIQVDGDGQHLPSEIPILLEELGRGTDLAIGARFLGRGDYDPPVLRKLGIRFFSFAVSTLVGRRFHDTTSGFRAANRRVVESFSRYYPYDYPEPEAILILSRAGFAVREVPARIQEREGGRSSITLRKSVYYLLKVFLALAVGRFRAPPD
ncbi:MAG: glycosyltransferase family 2 protein [Gemmatimonadetes bacterium]|nr:glycosyltransferase family 2 protein [Gemmatimonadota bacterium]